MWCFKTNHFVLVISRDKSVNNNPWRHWKDPQTSQVNKCPDIFRKCPTRTELRIAWKKHTPKTPRKVNNPFGTTPQRQKCSLSPSWECGCGYYPPPLSVYLCVYLCSVSQSLSSRRPLSSLARISGECSTIHSPPALFFFIFFFFLKWGLARAHLFHSLVQDQSTVAQRAETTVAKCSPTSCVWARFLTGCMDSGIVNPLRLRWVKAYAFALP